MVSSFQYYLLKILFSIFTKKKMISKQTKWKRKKLTLRSLIVLVPYIKSECAPLIFSRPKYFDKFFLAPRLQPPLSHKLCDGPYICNFLLLYYSNKTTTRGGPSLYVLSKVIINGAKIVSIHHSRHKSLIFYTPTRAQWFKTPDTCSVI